MNQILEKLSYDSEKESIKKDADELKRSIDNYDKLKLFDKINSMLTLFTNDIKMNESDLKKTEIELIGMLTGFISSLDDQIEIIREPLFIDKKRNLNLRPDLIFKDRDEKLVVEVKKVTPKKHDPAFEKRFLNYLESSEISQGIIYYLPSNSSQLVATMQTKRNIENKEYTIGINIASNIDYSSNA